MWPARKGQAQDPGHLVEGLPRGIVDRASQRSHVIGDIGNQKQAGVSAGDQHRHRWLCERAVLHDVDGHMGGQVVDAVERFAKGNRKRLGSRNSHQQCSSQTRTGSDRDRVKVIKANLGLAAGSLDHRHHGLEVGATGHLRHHPAESCVLFDAAGHGVGQQCVTSYDPDTGLVAGALDSEHQGASHVLTSLVASDGSSPGSSVSSSVMSHRCILMMSASTSPGW